MSIAAAVVCEQWFIAQTLAVRGQDNTCKSATTYSFGRYTPGVQASIQIVSYHIRKFEA